MSLNLPQRYSDGYQLHHFQIAFPAIPNTNVKSRVSRRVRDLRFGSRICNAPRTLARGVWHVGTDPGPQIFRVPPLQILLYHDGTSGIAHFGVDDIPVKNLGQLVFYRSKSEDKFSPNAKPGLFAGWRIEPGFSYHMVTYVLDLAKVKHRSGAWDDPFSVPEAELCVREGNPMFPLKNAAEQSLPNLGFADPSFEVPDPLPLPFSSWSGLTQKARFVSHIPGFWS